MQSSKPPRWKRKPKRHSGVTKPGDAQAEPKSARPAASPTRSSTPSPKKGKKKKGGDIPHHHFIQAAIEPVAEVQAETRTFDVLGLPPRLTSAIRHKGYTNMTPIQDQAIEPGLAGRDILGIAKTGSGKTAAFLIPLIRHWLEDERHPPALVLVPTRELAIQVEDEFRSLTKSMQLSSAVFIGGTNIQADIRKARTRVHLIVATPGRLLDLHGRHALDLRPVEALVLDEYDRMLDMGFINDVKKIIRALPNRRQTMLYSATIDPAQQEFIHSLLKDPVTVQVHSGTVAADHIDQDVIHVAPGVDKFDLLANLLDQDGMDKVLVFLESKHRVDKLAKKLVKAGFHAVRIHGDRSQGQRQSALEAFRAGKATIMVATDVAARGLDISDVTHVINYEKPRTMDSYIHRIGRTGRAGKSGQAYTFVSPED